MKKIFSLIAIFAITIFLIAGFQSHDKYGLHNYQNGLQKAFNICQDDANITIVAYYKFDEASGTVTDYSSNGLDLTAGGTPTYQQADFLSLNKSILITASTSDYFTHADDALFDLGTTTDFVMWAIIKLPSKATYRRICSKYKNTEGRYDWLISNAHYQRVYFAWNSPSVGNLDVRADTQGIDGNTWVLASLVVDRSSATGIDLFSNGTSDVSSKGDATALGDLDNSKAFFLGCGLTAGATPLDGTIAEFLFIKGDPLPDWVLSAAFQANLYQWTMGLPLTLPH